MVLSEYATLLFAFANTFIALFISVYAWLFLKKTNKHKDRRPWDFLFLASFLYLVFQIFNILVLSGVQIISETVNLYLVGNAMAFLYSGCVLLSFISQHDLILKSHLILISKKDGSEEAEATLDIGNEPKKK